MKRSNVKSMVVKVMTVGFLAGAFVMAASMKAQAQGFDLGVQIGYPHYDYGHRDYLERERWERERCEAIARQQAFERRQAFLRHEAWERREAWEHRGHDFDHDRDDRVRHDDRHDFYRR
jgi:hypothetical protein